MQGNGSMKDAHSDAERIAKVKAAAEALKAQLAPEEPHLDIDANVVRQLGEELITDPEQAILELIKNCYDADSKSAELTIISEYQPAPNEFPQEYRNAVPETKGVVEIVDFGEGMTLEQIQRGWLMISLSQKREMKRKGIKTRKYQRSPLGDKGLGRLGTMKLGSYLSIETYSAASDSGYRVFFSWNDCQSGKPLSSVKVSIVKIPKSSTTGTTLRIYGLHDASYWEGNEKLEKLAARLSILINPFGKFNSFTISGAVNNQPLKLEKITSQRRAGCASQFEYSWDKEKLNIVARIKYYSFKSGTADVFYDRCVSSDNGKALFEFLSNIKRLQSYNIHRSKTSGWHYEYNLSIAWSDLKNRKNRYKQKYTNPGPFEGVVDSFDLDSIPEGSNIFDSLLEYRNFVKSHAGLYVYRDNFGIRMPDDWLGLGKAWTSAKGYYSLKPNNCIGYFSISVDNNKSLLEKSDREGFIDNEAYQGFLALAQDVRDFANDILNTTRRGYLAFQKKIMQGIDPSDAQVNDPREELESLIKLINEATVFQSTLNNRGKSRNSELRRVESKIRELSTTKENAKLVLSECYQLSNQLAAQIHNLEEEEASVLGFLSGLAEKKAAAARIANLLSELNDRINQIYDMVGIGLSAQALSHDVNTHISEIVINVDKLSKRLKASSIDEAPYIRNIENVRIASDSIRSLVSLLDPMARGNREIRESVDLEPFLHEFFSLRGARLKKRHIKWILSDENLTSFKIETNRGRLMQIIDNLVTNSEYWLEQSFQDDTDGSRKLFLELKEPYLIYYDSGFGIRPDLEETLFELFVTGKPKTIGSGLGLFITTHLLARENCSIHLDQERNSQGRRYKFVINFSSIIK